MSDPEEILAYWFEAPAADAESLKRKIRRWYGGGAEIDREITARFGADVERAERGELAAWTTVPRTCVAAILVMDQFTRNVYRGTARAFALDPVAQRASLAALDAGFERDLSLEERMFVYMPLVHAEDLALQDRAVRCMESLVADAPPHLRDVHAIGVGAAHQHREAILRFGRFPARNPALGRTSTPEEVAFVEAAKKAGPPL